MEWKKPRTTSEHFQLLLQGDWGIVGTENFGCQTVHQLLKVFVQDRSLGGRQRLYQPLYQETGVITANG